MLNNFVVTCHGRFGTIAIITSNTNSDIATTTNVFHRTISAWKVSKYSFFWSVFFCVRTEYRKIRTRKKLLIWTLFTHYIPLLRVRFWANLPFLYPLKTSENLPGNAKKIRGFLTFSGGVEREHWPEIA